MPLWKHFKQGHIQTRRFQHFHYILLIVFWFFFLLMVPLFFLPRLYSDDTGVNFYMWIFFVYYPWVHHCFWIYSEHSDCKYLIPCALTTILTLTGLLHCCLLFLKFEESAATTGKPVTLLSKSGFYFNLIKIWCFFFFFTLKAIQEFFFS